MSDFVVALGLVLAFEGLIFAACPGRAKQAMMSVLDTPTSRLRLVGIGCATLGVALVWLVRG